MMSWSQCEMGLSLSKWPLFEQTGLIDLPWRSVFTAVYMCILDYMFVWSYGEFSAIIDLSCDPGDSVVRASCVSVLLIYLPV